GGRERAAELRRRAPDAPPLQRHDSPEIRDVGLVRATPVGLEEQERGMARVGPQGPPGQRDHLHLQQRADKEVGGVAEREDGQQPQALAALELGHSGDRSPPAIGHLLPHGRWSIGASGGSDAGAPLPSRHYRPKPCPNVGQGLNRSPVLKSEIGRVVVKPGSGKSTRSRPPYSAVELPPKW